MCKPSQPSIATSFNGNSFPPPQLDPNSSATLKGQRQSPNLWVCHPSMHASTPFLLQLMGIASRITSTEYRLNCCASVGKPMRAFAHTSLSFPRLVSSSSPLPRSPHVPITSIFFSSFPTLCLPPVVWTIPLLDLASRP